MNYASRYRHVPFTPANANAAVAKPETELTIAGCLETILSFVTSPDSNPEEGDNSGSTEIPEKEYDYVCEKLDITRVQAELFAAILELSLSGNATSDRLAHKIGCTNLHFIILLKEIDVLCEKRYVHIINDVIRHVPNYFAPEEVITCIQNNKRPSGEGISGLSSSGILRRIGGLFQNLRMNTISLRIFNLELNELLKYNYECKFVSEYKKLYISDINTCERVIFFFMVTQFYERRKTSFSWEDVADLFEDAPEEDGIRNAIECGDLELMRRGIVENANNDGIADSEHFCFAKGVIEKLLSEIKIKFEPEAFSSFQVLGPDRISEKQLFFNATEGDQLKTLTVLLQEANFNNVVRRLTEQGMRPGFCTLFYGGPGTGKTESVYQIARKTGRGIFVVDVSQLKSKWVGDSEKTVKELFDEYKNIVKNSKVAPILLFNEADAVFGIRRTGAEQAVDKMENTLQNIILQEMEDLQGIMIATTNLTQNFDSAFERRFIYKIEFHKPDIDARANIWASLMKDIDLHTAQVLARDFDFSGGQIENISRKATVDYILRGERPDIDSIRKLCNAETLSSGTQRNRIGF